VRYAVRASNRHDLDRLALAALHSDSAETVSRWLTDALNSILPELGSPAVSV
jgi:hypothetical protein